MTHADKTLQTSNENQTRATDALTYSPLAGPNGHVMKTFSRRTRLYRRPPIAEISQVLRLPVPLVLLPQRVAPRSAKANSCIVRNRRTTRLPFFWCHKKKSEVIKLAVSKRKFLGSEPAKSINRNFQKTLLIQRKCLVEAMPDDASDMEMLDAAIETNDAISEFIASLASLSKKH